MNSSIVRYLKSLKLNPDNFKVLFIVCDNVKLQEKNTGKILDIRW